MRFTLTIDTSRIENLAQRAAQQVASTAQVAATSVAARVTAPKRNAKLAELVLERTQLNHAIALTHYYGAEDEELLEQELRVIEIEEEIERLLGVEPLDI